jgi:hypothetical protein
MPKVSLSSITSGYGTVDALNANFDAIEAAFDNTLSRDGDTPNQMSANLDMNGFSILNQGNPITVEGFNWEGQWLTATDYQVGDAVQQSGSAYICVVAHTSGVFATDLAAIKWQLVAEANLQIIDHTGVTSIPPVSFTHSSVYSNADPYGTGTVVIEATGENNNQPLVFFRYNVNDTSFGNVGPVITNIGGSQASTTANNALAATLELVANNPLAATGTSYNTANGKFEIGVVSARDTGNADLREGYFYISPRRSSLNPSGVNTGFDGNIYTFLPATVNGGARFQTQGVGIEIEPKYDYTIDSRLTYTDAYNNSVWTNWVTASGKYARIENISKADGYIRTRSTDGQASVFIQSEANNSNGLLEVRSNWVSSGTGSSIVNLYTANDGTGWRIQANGANNTLNIRRLSAGTIIENVDISETLDGLVSVYRQSDYTKGRIRLGNNGGAIGGGVIEYDSNTGQLSISGTNNYITTGSSGYVKSTRIDTAAPATGSTVTPGAFITDYIITSGSLAALTIQYPTGVQNGHPLTIMTTNSVTTLTVNAAGSATVLGAPTSMSANGFFTLIYRSSNNTWYRKG